MIFGSEPEECLEATPRLMPKGFDQRCDQASMYTYYLVSSFLTLNDLNYPHSATARIS